MTAKGDWKLLLVFISFTLLLQVIYILGVDWSRAYNRMEGMEAVAGRVALDMARLPLASQAAYEVEQGEVVAGYIQRLNDELERQQSPVLLLDIGALPQGRLSKTLITPTRELVLTFAEQPRVWINYFSPVTLLLALLLTLLYRTRLISVPRPREEVTEELSAPRLIIDLQQRTLRNSSGGEPVVMANKPLCFYVALLEFSAEDKETLLSQNKEMPEALQALADKYFMRLIELGHTVRKRPNFKNSLEKTLSDIRAVLDEVYSQHPDLKVAYYPPKAHGEGSRSRLHHYGLKLISTEDYEILGR